MSSGDELDRAERRGWFVRTSGIAALANVVLLVIAVVDTAVTARLLGATGKGTLFLFTTTVSVAVLVAGGGLGTALQVATSQSRVAISDAARFCALLALGWGVVAGVAALLIGRADVLQGLAGPGALLIPAELVVWLVTPLFVVADRVGRRSMAEVVAATLDVMLTAGFILTGGDRVFRAALGIVIARWLFAGFLLHDLWSVSGEAAETGWRRRALFFGLRQQPGNLAARAAKRADSFILAGFLGPRAVGVYSVASSLAEVPLFVARAVQPSVVSFVARLDRTSARDVARMARGVLSLYGVALPLYGLIATLSLRPLVGDSFGGAIAPLWILLVPTGCMALHLVLNGYFVGIGRPGLLTVMIGIPVIVNLALSFVLIPSFGLSGDALASAIGGFGTAAMTVHLFCRNAALPVREVLVPRSGDMAATRSVLRDAAARVRHARR